MSLSNWLLSPFVAFPIRQRMAFLRGRPFVARDKWGTFVCPDRITAVQFIPRCQHEVQDEIAKVAGPGRLFVDVGAHIGRFSIMAAKMGMRVIALEPNKANCRYLRMNVEGNFLTNKIEVIEAAAWSETGPQFFHTSPRSDLGTLLQSDLLGNRLEDGYYIEALTLDDVLAKSPPAFIKIDVEGADFEVLQGATKTLEDKRPTVMFECVRMFRIEECARLLGSLDYGVKRVGQWNHLATPR